ncbi:MAG: phosphoglycerate dehydrogenase [Clostridiales bacterium]|nr:phosphoglycerate dehydrogenase [Clostridiales bacterium]
MKNIYCYNVISHYGTDMFSDEYAMVDDVSQADGILVRSASLHEVEFPPSLKAIARAGAGVNNIPLEKCADEGIVVFNTPGANANGVKELVFAGLLLSARDIVGGIEWVKENQADEGIAKSAEKAKKAFAGHEIQGKKLGVIGLGAIGVLVANMAANLGMTVYGYDPFISIRNAWMLSGDVKHTANVETIYEECDYITIHVPAMDSTKGMLNKDAFAKMKDGTVILNFARDVLVNDDDMIEALASGRVRRYVTDFPNAKSARMKGAIVIPHLGASTEESEDNCAKMAVVELKDYLENGNIRNSVNYPACDMGPKKAPCRMAVMHLNIPNMIGQVTGALAASGINISDMTNKSRDKYAYTLLDMDRVPEDAIVQKLSGIEGVLRVRII